MMDTDNLPARVPTSRVAALLGYSVRTLQRRRSSGSLKLAPVDRGAELLFARADVLRELGIAPPTPETQAKPVAGPSRPIFSAEAVRAIADASPGRAARLKRLAAGKNR